MLTVNTQARPPVRVDLEPLVTENNPDGDPAKQQHILFRAWETAALATGKGTAATALRAGQDVDVALVGFTIAAARWGALSWVGPLDVDGAPLAVTPDNAQALLQQFQDVYEAVNLGYVLPALERELERESEKNVSAPSPTGTSPAGAQKNRGRASRSADGTTARLAQAAAKSAPTN